MSAVERVEYMAKHAGHQQRNEAWSTTRGKIEQKTISPAKAASGGVVPMPPTPPTKRVIPPQRKPVSPSTWAPSSETPSIA
eukprot:gene28280-31388_t